jgi:outer membrane protein OmpA-like peptidoglycan-associated protein
MRSLWAIVAAPLFLTPIGCGSEPPPEPKVAAPAPAKPPADADGDGVADDGTDKCLVEKEDGLPPDPKDGCLSTDPDGDGLAGADDKCPAEKEDGLAPDKKDGCASVDPDNDGLIGATDKCPDKPETNNDFQDDDGCPDVVPRVRVTKNEVKINEKILFAFAKATIEPESQSLIEEIAFVINDNPQIEYIEVAGHADKVGTDATNAQLTKRRAQAVLDALVKLKVNKRRLHAQGYGRYCPLDKGESEEAKEKNRRVEFKIMRIDGVETGVTLGCEESASKGIKPAKVPATAPTRAELEAAKKANPPVPPAPSAAKPATPARPATPGLKPATPAKPAIPPRPTAKPGAKPLTGKAPAPKTPPKK